MAVLPVSIPDTLIRADHSKCVETQTPLSGFLPYAYDSRTFVSHQAPAVYWSPPSLLPLRVTAPTRTTKAAVESDMDMPLNLSTSHTSPHPSPTSSPGHRASPPSTSVRLTSSDQCCDIDEHFRRSLAKYAAVQPRPSPPPFDGSVRVVSSSSQPQSPTSSPPVSPSASSDTNRMRSLTVANSPPRPMKRASPSAEAQLSESVDDHFAKSLGMAWKKLKHDADSPSPTSSVSVTADEVDEHFARSLGGAVWQTIH